MQQSSWEKHATTLANAPTDEDVWKVYESLGRELSVNSASKAKVVFARDTRASGSRLVAALVEGLKAADAEYTDYKLLTTPQLHYITRCINTKGSAYEYGEATEQGYYKKLAKAFQRAMKGKSFNGGLTVDCANGVGGPKMNEFLKVLPSPAEGGLDIKVVNDDVLQPELLNHQACCLVPKPHPAYHLSAEPTLLRRTSALRHLRRPGALRAAARLMVMRTASSTTSLMRMAASISWMATASQH